MTDIVLKRIAADLAKIDGVSEVVITSKDGVVMVENAASEPDTFGALCTFAGNIGEQVCVDMNLGALSSVVLSGAGSRVLTLPHQDCFIGAGISTRTSVAIVGKEIQAILPGM